MVCYYCEDIDWIGFGCFDVEFYVLEFIGLIVELIWVLVDFGYVYEVFGDVYFCVCMLLFYGELFKCDID